MTDDEKSQPDQPEPDQTLSQRIRRAVTQPSRTDAAQEVPAYAPALAPQMDRTKPPTPTADDLLHVLLGQLQVDIIKLRATNMLLADEGAELRQENRQLRAAIMDLQKKKLSEPSPLRGL
jgi:hypothetical protein